MLLLNNNVAIALVTMCNMFHNTCAFYEPKTTKSLYGSALHYDVHATCSVVETLATDLC